MRSQADPSSFTAANEWSGIMGFSRDERPFVGPVPDVPPGLFIAAGYTGHGMPNTWLCGKAVALMAARRLDGLDEAEAVKEACESVGLPGAYLVDGVRMRDSTSN